MDIFSIPKKEVINKTLLGKVINVAGKTKVGKSTICSQAPDPVFLCTENGVEGLAGFVPVPIGSWTEFTQAVNQLCTPQGKERFKTVVIDSVTQLLTLLEKYEGSRQSTEKVTYQFASDMDYGKGNKGMKLLLGTQLQKLINQGYLVLCITHCEDKSDFSTGRQYIGSAIPNSLYGILDRLVDQTVYLEERDTKTGKEYRTWFSKKGGFANTGGRWSPKEEYVKTSFQNVEKAILDAMVEQGEKVGAQFTEEMNTSVAIHSDDSLYNYDALLQEMNEITEKLVGEDDKNVTKISKSVASVLGSNRKASSLTRNQVELLAEVVNTLKNDFSLN